MWETTDKLVNDIPGFVPGDKVTYRRFRNAALEHGIVKALHPTKSDVVFVVFSCAGDWANFNNYTSAATDTKDLEHGWL